MTFTLSTFFNGPICFCGKPGEAFLRELAGWKRPEGVDYPTFRRIDWRTAAAGRSGARPTPRSDDPDDVERYHAELFLWAKGCWRGVFGPQIHAIVTRPGAEFSRRECHPFTFGYAKGAIVRLAEEASRGSDWSPPGLISSGALADVFGLFWVDEISEAIADFSEGNATLSTSLSFRTGVQCGSHDMNGYLDGTNPEPRHLLERFQ